MNRPAAIQIGLLIIGAAGGVWMAAIASRRRQMPGSRAFAWLNLAVALWCLMSAIHSIPQSIGMQLIWTRLQYFGISAIPPLWLRFAAEYVRMPWAHNRAVSRALWIVPALILLAVLTNDWHRLYFRAVDRVEGVTVYHWGPLFWIAAAHNYLLLAAGTLFLMRGLWLFPGAYYGQTAILAAGALVPWFGNAAYISGAFRPGFDPTPVLFAVSMALFFWGLYAHQLFDVIPMARAAVFERLSDAVFVLDRAYRVIDANTAAVAMAEGAGPPPRTLGQVIGRHPLELLPWWPAKAPPAPADASPLQIAHGDRLLEVQATSLVGTLGQGGSLLWIRDLTARRRAEDGSRT